MSVDFRNPHFEIGVVEPKPALVPDYVLVLPTGQRCGVTLVDADGAPDAKVHERWAWSTICPLCPACGEPLLNDDRRPVVNATDVDAYQVECFCCGWLKRLEAV